LKSDFRAMSKPPDQRHYFGTDQIGRDVLSRVLYGSRASLTVAIGAVLFGTTLGALWGLASGYFGGRIDIVSQRIIEFLQSFPDLILAMAIAMALGAGIGTVIVAIAITRIPFGGRVIRAVVLSLKEISYVEAARGLGASHLRIMLRHILPQCMAPYLILATTHLGVAIVIEAALGFLGVGIPPPTPTWGNMLADSLNAGLVPPWWLVLFPGSRSPSPCWPSICLATASATYSIPGCAAPCNRSANPASGRNQTDDSRHRASHRDCFVAPLLAMTAIWGVIASEAKQSW
jgi:ABC-type dipeptide/oligopeptide/nickel transport system permease subunit